MSHLHASNEVRGRLTNAVTHCQTVGPAGVMQVKKWKKKNNLQHKDTSMQHQFKQIDPVNHISVMRADLCEWMPLPTVEQGLHSGIIMLSMRPVQKWFLGQIKFVNLFVKPPLPLWHQHHQMGLAGYRSLLRSSQACGDENEKLINEVTCYFGQKW